MDDRLDNGVRRRMDNLGDGWAAQHRETMRDAYMQDIDCIFGASFFGANTGERLFEEYVPDNRKNIGQSIRRFAVVAMFDRKKTEAAAFSEIGSVVLSRAFYLWQCRILSQIQPRPVRFFYVIGENEPPWIMKELSTETAEVIGDTITLGRTDWNAIWKAIGLQEERRILREWLEKETA